MTSPRKAQTLTAEVNESLQKLRHKLDGGNIQSILPRQHFLVFH